MQSIPTLHLRVSLLRSHDAPRHDATQAQPPLCRKVVFVLLVSGRHVPLNCLPNSKHNLLGWLSQQAVPEHPPIAYEAASQPASQQAAKNHAGRQAGSRGWFRPLVPMVSVLIQSRPSPSPTLALSLSACTITSTCPVFLPLFALSWAGNFVCVFARDGARDGEQE